MQAGSRGAGAGAGLASLFDEAAPLAPSAPPASAPPRPAARFAPDDSVPSASTSSLPSWPIKHAPSAEKDLKIDKRKLRALTAHLLGAPPPSAAVPSTAAWLLPDAQAHRGGLFVLTGPPGVGKHAALRVLAAERGITIVSQPAPGTSGAGWGQALWLAAGGEAGWRGGGGGLDRETCRGPRAAAELDGFLASATRRAGLSFGGRGGVGGGGWGSVGGAPGPAGAAAAAPPATPLPPPGGPTSAFVVVVAAVPPPDDVDAWSEVVASLVRWCPGGVGGRGGGVPGAFPTVLVATETTGGGGGAASAASSSGGGSGDAGGGFSSALPRAAAAALRAAGATFVRFGPVTDLRVKAMLTEVAMAEGLLPPKGRKGATPRGVKGAGAKRRRGGAAAAPGPAAEAALAGPSAAEAARVMAAVDALAAAAGGDARAALASFELWARGGAAGRGPPAPRGRGTPPPAAGGGTRAAGRGARAPPPLDWVGPGLRGAAGGAMHAVARLLVGKCGEGGAWEGASTPVDDEDAAIVGASAAAGAGPALAAAATAAAAAAADPARSVEATVASAGLAPGSLLDLLLENYLDRLKRWWPEDAAMAAKGEGGGGGRVGSIGCGGGGGAAGQRGVRRVAAAPIDRLHTPPHLFDRSMQPCRPLPPFSGVPGAGPGGVPLTGPAAVGGLDGPAPATLAGPRPSRRRRRRRAAGSASPSGQPRVARTMAGRPRAGPTRAQAPVSGAGPCVAGEGSRGGPRSGRGRPPSSPDETRGRRCGAGPHSLPLTSLDSQVCQRGAAWKGRGPTAMTKLRR